MTKSMVVRESIYGLLVEVEYFDNGGGVWTAVSSSFDGSVTANSLQHAQATMRANLRLRAELKIRQEIADNLFVLHDAQVDGDQSAGSAWRLAVSYAFDIAQSASDIELDIAQRRQLLENRIRAEQSQLSLRANNFAI